MSNLERAYGENLRRASRADRWPGAHHLSGELSSALAAQRTPVLGPFAKRVVRLASAVGWLPEASRAGRATWGGDFGDVGGAG
jgi:hypothetical protein